MIGNPTDQLAAGRIPCVDDLVLEPAKDAPPGDVTAVHRVPERIRVVVGAASLDGVDAQEASEGDVVGACTHFDDGGESGFVFGEAAGLAEIAEVGAIAGGVANGSFTEWFVVEAATRRGSRFVGGEHDVTVEVGVGVDTGGMGG